jgi:hypothetical protein
METGDKDAMNSILFFQLVATFQNAAWQQLGKRVNPITQKMERDFEQASLSIGMLDMLLAKTTGNLSDEESRFLESAISDLKLNYVEEVNKPDQQKTDEEKSESTEKEPVAESAANKDEDPGKSADSPQADTAKQPKKKAAASRKKKQKKA